MTAISVRDVSKTYRIPHERHTTLAERLLSIFRPNRVDVLEALKGVTIDVPSGGFVGVIGANGSGKSTLLKLMAGIIVPDEGSVQVSGTVSPLLELGLGFHQELTVRENAGLYGAVLGYPRQDMARRVDEVITFAGLERFRDVKLKSLSSGMLVRLAFATALRADADILLLDEVLAVGDVQFQRKCLEVFNDLKRRRRTIVLVSHDLSAIQRFCDRTFWLDKGRLVMAGEASEVIQTYMAFSQSLLPDAAPLTDHREGATHRSGDGRVRFVAAALEDERGTAVTAVRAGERVVLRLTAEVRKACVDPVFGFVVRLGAQIVYSTNTYLLGLHTGEFLPGDRVQIRIPFVAALNTARYIVDVAIANYSDATIYDWVNNLMTFSVDHSSCGEGIADLAAEFHCELVDGEQLAHRRIQLRAVSRDS